MVHNLAVKLSNKLYQRSGISYEDDDVDVVIYGLECIINITITCTILFIFGSIIHSFVGTIIWLVGFSSLRNHMGGYHASSHISCIVLSSAIGIISPNYSW